MLRLTQQQLQMALAGLKPSERLELLQLLETREHAEASRPVNDRYTIEQMLLDIRDQRAAATEDPPAYVRAWDEHHTAMWRHCERLARQRPVSPTISEHPTLEEIDEGRSELAEAKVAATEEGFPCPDDVFRKSAPPLPEEDPLAKMRRASLPKATRGDIEETTARRAEAEAFRRAAREDATFHRPASGPADEPDKLSAFRGQGPLSYPPAYDDS